MSQRAPQQTHKRSLRQRGMAVVGALIVVTVAAALTSGLFMRQTATARQTENAAARAQARWLLMGGLDWARLILRDNVRREATVRGDQLWASPIRDTRIDQLDPDSLAVFSGSVEDEQGKFNVYRLAQTGIIDPTMVIRFTNLLSAIGLPPTLAPRMADAVATMQPRGAAPGDKTGSGSGTNTANGSNSAHANQGSGNNNNTDWPTPAARGIDDLAQRFDLDEPARKRLRRVATLLPQATELNINTAPAEVLSAWIDGLSPAQARTLTESRDGGQWFVNAGDLTNRIRGLGLENTPQHIGVTSTWFTATGTVVLDRARVTMRALILAAPNATPAIVWRQDIL
ncbi:type II secretion system minor pseudopilin GspK [Alcaligenaceae bacterium C4P045]|nr:type II secretion system minor pseudopilin GspK [Alcaligenaceae bacterium C4P045]